MRFNASRVRRWVPVLAGVMLLVVAGVFLWGDGTKSETKKEGSISRPSVSSAPGTLPVSAAARPAVFKRQPGRAGHSELPVPAGTLRQVEERIREKKQRQASGGEGAPKLSSPLAVLAQKVEAALAQSLDPRRLSIPGVAKVDAAGAIQVYVETLGDPGGVLAAIQAAGLKTEVTVPESHQIQGWISASQLAGLSSLDQVRRATLPGYAYKHKGSVTTEGDAKLKADKVRALVSPGPYTGEGTKVCVISDGCNSRAASVASGDLPAEGIIMHPTLQDSGDEGTAMAEIIHDLAPGAKLYAAGPSTSLEMVVAIQWAVAQGCRVICDDLGFWDQPFFEDGSIAVAARAAVVNNGAVVVSSAGNEADEHYQGTYDAFSGDTVHDFQAGSGEDSALDIVVPADGWAVVYLQWNDEFGQSGNDYDLLLSDPGANGEIVASSESPQTGSDLPSEELYWQNTSGVEKTMHVLIDKYAGSAKTLEVFVSGDAYLIDDDWVPRDSIYGHPAVSEVISVGAIDQADPGLLNLETYSSQGPSTIAFPSSQSRQTPTIIAVDGVSVTGAGGFDSPFFGTSASAPHVAGICALMLDKNPDASPTLIKSVLTSKAVDRGAVGFDNSFGHGLVDALAAVNGLSAPGNGPEMAVELSSGGELADKGAVSFGTVSAGSTSRRTFTVKNTGSTALTGLAVTKDGLNVVDFSVGSLPVTSLAPGAQTSFDVVFYPSANGSRTAALHIVSNDGDESPFDIMLQGARAAYAGKGSTTGKAVWNRPAENGPNVPTELSQIGLAVPYETFRFTVGTSGTYTIRGMAMWDDFLVLYADSFNSSSPLSNVLRAYGGFPVWGTVELPVRLSAGTTYILVTTGYSDSDLGDYTLEITGPGIVSPSGQPEIVVSQAASSVALGNGAGATAFGNIKVGSASAPLVFTIRNSGVGDLTGVAVTKDGVNADDFTVSSPGVTTLSAGANATFSISFAPGAGGSRFAAIHIASNDGDENPFDILLTGSGIVPPPDTTSPVLSVTTPTNNAKLTAPSAAFVGKIVETGGVPTVEYSTDGGTNWTAGTVTSGSSPYAWTVAVPLAPGANTVQLRATDLSGNTGNVVSRSVSYLQASTAPLQITASGNGTFTDGLSGKNLNLNMPYTVTAKPGKGQIFKEWLKNGVSFSRDATLTFTMEEGLELTPVFITNPYPGVKDTYNGLAGEGDLRTGSEADREAFFEDNGFVSVTTTDSGGFSGTLRLEGKDLSLKGQFDGYGEETVAVKRTGKSNAVVELAFDTTAPGKISGNVTTDGSPMAFTALPGEYSGSKTDVHPLGGKRYTVILPAPDSSYGHGYATLVVAANGAATFAGKLADGTSFTSSARVVDDGSGNWVIPVHKALYTGSQGMIWGEVLLPQVEPTGAADVVGSLGWLRPADAKAKLFAEGFLEGLEPNGESYTLSKDVSLFSGNATTANFTLEVDQAGTVLGTTVTQGGTWPSTNKPVLTVPVGSKLTLTFTGTSGVFKGTFSRTVSGKAVSTPYEGVVLRNELTLPGASTAIRGGGFFSTGTASGGVEMTVP